MFNYKCRCVRLTILDLPQTYGMYYGRIATNPRTSNNIPLIIHLKINDCAKPSNWLLNILTRLVIRIIICFRESRYNHPTFMIQLFSWSEELICCQVYTKKGSCKVNLLLPKQILRDRNVRTAFIHLCTLYILKNK